MDEMQNMNHVLLCGAPAGDPAFSHASRLERFFTFPLEVSRLSGTMDRLNIILREELAARAAALPGRGCCRWEESSVPSTTAAARAARLVITVFAREIGPPEENVWENQVELLGTLCKPPNRRTTPMGREICDLMIAVNRHYGRSDYLPCIAWGQNARLAAGWAVGTRVRVLGRIQSREYIKNINGEPVTRTAFEVSAGEIAALPDA